MKGLAAIAAATVMAGVALAPPAQADYLFNICPGGIAGVASTVTSCPFANNVRASWFANPSSLITAYSPVTGQAYYMSCRSDQYVRFAGGGSRLAVRCDGGRNAAVVFW